MNPQLVQFVQLSICPLDQCSTIAKSCCCDRVSDLRHLSQGISVFGHKREQVSNGGYDVVNLFPPCSQQGEPKSKVAKGFCWREAWKGLAIETSGSEFNLKSQAGISDFEEFRHIPDHHQNLVMTCRSVDVSCVDVVTRATSSANALDGVQRPVVLLCPTPVTTSTCKR
jgi:hypothetical protein